eukprot:7015955-Pyramimonas_sp.AAC.1
MDFCCCLPDDPPLAVSPVDTGLWGWAYDTLNGPANMESDTQQLPVRRVFPVRVYYHRVPPCPCVLCA